MIRDLIAFIKRMKRLSDYEWRRVPPPEWKAKRGGINYW
jgi:hypothetical protein